MSSFIEVYDDALDEELCRQIIEQFESQPDRRYAGQTGDGVDRTKKDSTDLNISIHADWLPTNQKILQVVLSKFNEYIDKHRFLIAGAMTPTIRDSDNGEAFVLDETTFDRLNQAQLNAVTQRLYRPGALIMQKYLQGVGGYHHWHFESYPQDAQCDTLHRALLFMFYLNDVEDGGETAFFYQDLEVKPKRGRMVIAPAYFTHTHKGCVPKSGDKYILTSWILFQRAEHIYGPPPAQPK